MRLLDRLIALGRWGAVGVLVGLLCGASSALFLWLLDLVTRVRSGDERLVYALPVAGLGIGWVYERLGASIKGGNNLVLDRVHDGGPPIPGRMAPLVLLGTVATHLFGGSAGREGTAVQMGASLADGLAQRLRASEPLRHQILASGIAGGFGAVFGTPIAGTLFALEVVVLGRMDYGALVPALIAALVGDLTTHHLGVGHTIYPSPSSLAMSPSLLLRWVLFAAVVALVTTAFIELTHGLKKHGERLVPRLPLRMALGGALLVVLWKLVGTSDYLGLGVPTIERAFRDPTLPPHAFALKLLFTAITLGAGFLGGEVTPLFFVGATLGNALARPLGLPIELAAGVGLAAVFASASNAPLALSIMAVELLGAAVLPHAVLVSVLAFLLSGHRSIYPSQRIARTKHGQPLPAPIPLRDLPPDP
jgi:H+/Cl- antiporter ClcA